MGIVQERWGDDLSLYLRVWAARGADPLEVRLNRRRPGAITWDLRGAGGEEPPPVFWTGSRCRCL